MAGPDAGAAHEEGDDLASNETIVYSVDDWGTSSHLRAMVSAALFAQSKPKLSYALSNYCYAYFVYHVLGDSPMGGVSHVNKKWYNFFFNGGPMGQTSSTRATAGNLLRDGGGLVMPDDFKNLAALVTWTLALVYETDEEPDINAFGVDVAVTNDKSSKISVRSEQIYKMLRYDDQANISADGFVSVFDVFCEFVVSVLDDVVERTNSLDADLKFYYQTDDGTRVTRNGGLDSRAFVFMCYRIFKNVFVAHPDGSGGDSTDSTVPIILNGTGPGTGWEGTYLEACEMDLNDDPYTFFIPHTFRYRNSNAAAACNANDAVSSFWAFSTAREDTDVQLRQLVTGLGHLGMIRRAVWQARQKCGTITVGSAAPDLLKEFLPKGQPDKQEKGKTLFSRFGEGHIANVYKNIERQLPFSNLASNVSYLPYHQTCNPSSPHLGRLPALRGLLSKTFHYASSEENIFDPSNAKILCIGLPAGSTRALHEPSTALNNEDIRSGENTIEGTGAGQYSRGKSVFRVDVTKKDALLPDVGFEDMQFYYDPRLFVAAGGYDAINDSSSVMDQLNNVQFKRMVVDPGTGEVSLKDASFNEETGWENAGSALNDLEPGPAKQVAMTAVQSDLFDFYLSIVCGMELNDGDFQIEDDLLDQRVDTNMTITAGDVSLVDVLRGVSALDVISTTLPILGDDIDAVFTDSVAFGDFEIQKLKALPTLLPLVDASGGDIVQVQQILSSLFFNPHKTRTELIYPRRFDGVVFCLIDPDTFKVGEWDTSDFGQPEYYEEELLEANIAQRYPDDPDGSAYLIKTGGNEDATGIIELTVTVVPIEATDAVELQNNPYAPMTTSDPEGDAS